MTLIVNQLESYDESNLAVFRIELAKLQKKLEDCQKEQELINPDIGKATALAGLTLVYGFDITNNFKHAYFSLQVTAITRESWPSASQWCFSWMLIWPQVPFMGAGEKTPNLFEVLSPCTSLVHTAPLQSVTFTCTLTMISWFWGLHSNTIAHQTGGQGLGAILLFTVTAYTISATHLSVWLNWTWPVPHMTTEWSQPLVRSSLTVTQPVSS